MKKFTIPCDFGGKKAPFDVYIGMPKPGNHPLQNQAHWLASERGGTIPGEVMESFSKLLALSEKNGVSFEDLCVYALEAANEEKKRKKKVPPPASGNPPPSGSGSSAPPPPAAPTGDNNANNNGGGGNTGSQQGGTPNSNPNQMKIEPKKVPADQANNGGDGSSNGNNDQR